MKIQVARPDESFSKEERDKLARYLAGQWRRVERSRTEQLDRYEAWTKNYSAIPAEKVRNVPWYKSSNFVVPVIRIFLDTFVARTLNIIFATRPLYTTDGFPSEVKEALEMYLNRKALYEWDAYTLTRDLLLRGNKNGTAVVKTLQIFDSQTYVQPGPSGSGARDITITKYDGPRNFIIPFEDFAVYPITANYMRDVQVRFNRLRYTEEEGKRRWRNEGWDIASEEEFEQMLKIPNDLKRQTQQEDAGVVDAEFREIHLIECHHDWEIGGTTYSLVSLLHPDNPERLIDVCFNFAPNNWDIFQDYRPFPQEDFFYGDSMARLLEQAQEETSQIHNDRRNNTFIANAPVFVRKNGSPVPNPSTNWYPGKVFDVDDISDFTVISVGRNLADTLSEENWGLQLAERLIGIGAVMQGNAAGMMGKRGIYNAAGTLAILSESNQRQDTNIRDIREVLGAIGRTNLAFQAAFNPKDPLIDTFPHPLQEQVRQALAMATPDKLRYSRLEVKTSNAGSNSEVSKQNLMQMVGVLNNYAGTVQQLIVHQLDPKLNPGLRLIINDTLNMMKWLATRVLRAYDEYDAEGVLPDARAAIEAAVPGGSRSSKDGGAEAGDEGMVTGAAGEAIPATSRAGLQTILAIPPISGGANGNAGMEQPNNMGPV